MKYVKEDVGSYLDLQNKSATTWNCYCYGILRLEMVIESGRGGFFRFVRRWKD